MRNIDPDMQAPAKRRRRWILPTVLVVIAFTVGMNTGKGDPPEPVVEIQKERVEVPKEVIKEVVKEVPSTPQACLTALDLAAEGIGMNQDVAEIAVGYIALIPLAAEAGANGSEGADIIHEMGRLTDETDKLTARMDKLTPKLATASQECRAGADAKS